MNIDIQDEQNEQLKLLLDIITNKPYRDENILICNNILKNFRGIINYNINNNPLTVEVLIAHQKHFQSLDWFIYLIKNGANPNHIQLLEFINQCSKSKVYKEILFNVIEFND